MAPQTAAALSIPNSGLTVEVATSRRSAIAAYLPLIENVNRVLPIGGGNYTYYYGPEATSDSLTEQIRATELAFSTSTTQTCRLSWRLCWRECWPTLPH